MAGPSAVCPLEADGGPEREALLAPAPGPGATRRVLLAGALLGAVGLAGALAAARRGGAQAGATAEAVGLSARWSPHFFGSYEDALNCIGGVRDGVEFQFFAVDSPCGHSCCKRTTSTTTTPAAATATTPSGTTTPTPPPKRRASFFAIGDWGYDQRVHGGNVKPECQSRIAEKMQEWMQMLGDVKFVINVGDSFYPGGVRGKWDNQWNTKWRNVFPPRVRSIPWYSVYGNHDYQSDPCICSDDLSKCAQINANEHNLNYFVMPNYTYYKAIPELDMEIIAMDTNQFMEGWNHSLTRQEHTFADCRWTQCQDSCTGRAQQRTSASFDLFYERMERSAARNLLVFSHYPTDYFAGGAPEFLDALRTPKKNITFFGGHRHNVDQVSTESISPNTNWLVGGGGGWSCDGGSQGFVIGQVMEDYSVRTWPVILDPSACCKI